MVINDALEEHAVPKGISPLRVRLIAATFVAALLLPAVASAHGVARGDARFLQTLTAAAVAPLMYLGAKHMVTGYDHLLFLVGVVFFLLPHARHRPLRQP